MTKAPVLSFFDPSTPIEIENDASKDGLGSCMSQNNHPVGFASRSLSKTEIRYSQIEKELLAIVFSVQKFHYFIYGVRNVTIYSDHKPLEAIFKKDLNSVPPRLQRMLFKIMPYDIKVVYKPGKFLYVADTLSRASLANVDTKLEVDLSTVVHSIEKYLPMSNEKKSQFKKVTLNDSDIRIYRQL